LAALWNITISEKTVRYVAAASAAIRLAAESNGVAVLLNPTPLETVFALAAAGERMPQKSTLFAPKPRAGLVLRIYAVPDVTAAAPDGCPPAPGVAGGGPGRRAGRIPPPALASRRARATSISHLLAGPDTPRQNRRRMDPRTSTRSPADQRCATRRTAGSQATQSSASMFGPGEGVSRRTTSRNEHSIAPLGIGLSRISPASRPTSVTSFRCRESSDMCRPPP